MKRLNKMVRAMAVAGVLCSGVTQAALIDRGGGLLYDDVLKVTWLQDANYAKTSGYDSDGRMNWNAAVTWASSLDISRFAGESLSGWRLASNAPVVPGDWNANFSYDGSTNMGYNITSPNSELAYMYYINLRLKGFYSPTGDIQPDFGVFGDGTIGGQKDVSPVKNLQSASYWSGTNNPQLPADTKWHFATNLGGQGWAYQTNELYAWAVRPGDVAAVPEPETYALLLAGLGLLGVVANRRRRSFAAS